MLSAQGTIDKTDKDGQDELERIGPLVTTQTGDTTFFESQNVVSIGDAPDGGIDAWLVLLGSALALFASFGIVNSYVSNPPPLIIYLSWHTIMIFHPRAYTKIIIWHIF